MKQWIIVFVILIVSSMSPLLCCISDPTVTVVYDMEVDTDLLKSLKKEGFSFEIVSDVIPSFGAPGTREFIVYKGHYGLSTAMVAYDMIVLKTHEEHYDWENGIKTELLFLQTIGVVQYVDVENISEAASWESGSGKNLFHIPEGVEYVSFGDSQYPVSQPVQTDYFYLSRGWIAVPGNATVSVNAEGDVLSIVLLRCGAEISADTRNLSLFAPFRRVVLLCNSIDYELTGRELKTLLEERGYKVIRIAPQNFEVYRWFSPKIIMLGGHKSPEGMGEIVNDILSESEKLMIEKKGFALFAHEDVDFRKQLMIVLAGKDREETREITLSRIEDIVLWIEYNP